MLLSASLLRRSGVCCLLLGLVSCGGSSGWETDGSSSSSSGSSTSTSSTSSTTSSGSSSSSSSSSSGAMAENCSRAEIATSIETTLGALTTDTDFAFYVEDQNEQSFAYNRGSATLDTVYDSASTSKWVTAALIIDLVDQNILTLNDRPQDHLSPSEWSIPETDPLYNITLAQLLNFTSGLTQEAGCRILPQANFFTCVNTISEQNIGNGETPGAEFNYNSSHLQVAGAMAIRAAGLDSWQEIFGPFAFQNGLFANSDYSIPSQSNPLLAGGMTWTGNDYIQFMRAFIDADFYSSMDVVNNASSDQLGGAAIGSSPAFDGLGEQWHYGFGLWIECHDSSFICGEATQVSSPGAYGAYPFWNKQHNYFGIVARQGDLGTFTDGYQVFDAVRSEVESWVQCANE